MKRKIVKKTLSSIVVFCLIFFTTISTFMVNAYADSGTADELVTEFYVDQNTIQDGGSTTVHLKFAENSMRDIRGGDTIKVNWQRAGQPTFSGFHKEEDLRVKGRKIAKLIVTPDGATITFNSDVDALDNVEGYAFFMIEGRNLTSTSEEDTKTGHITVGSKRLDVSVTKPATGVGTGAFYYKAGRMDPNDTDRLNWWLSINTNRAQVYEDIVIKDEIQAGHELDPATLNITVEGYHPGTLSGTNVLTEFSTKYPGSSINISGNVIDVRIAYGYATGNKFVINYKTTITNKNQAKFDNKTKAWYHEVNKPKVEGESFDASVDNVNAGGGMNGTLRGELKIVKVVDGTKKGIPGVSFLLKREDGSVIKEGKSEITLITNSEGIANIRDLPVGRYNVKEMNAPEWIDFDPFKAEKIEFTVSDSDAQGTVLDISNKLKTIDIKVVKKWEDENNKKGIRPNKIKISLLAGTAVKETVEITPDAQGKWEHDFGKYPKHENGEEIKYSVREEAVGGYSTVYEGDAKNGFVVVNKTNNIPPPTDPYIPYVPSPKSEYKEISGLKKWIGDENGNRPESITVRLIDKETGKQVKTTEATEKKGWKYTFKDVLAKDASGKVYNYSVDEVVPAGYKVSYDGTTIINEKIPEKPVLPQEPPTPKEPEKPVHVDEPLPVLPAKLLPKTGDGPDRSMYAVLVGIAGLIIIAAGTARRKN